MEDLDKALVASLLRDGKPALKKARERGLRPDLLLGEGKTVYEFLVDYHLRYDDLPPKDLVKGRTGIDLEDLPSGWHADYLVGEIFNRKTFGLVFDGYKKIQEQIQATSPDVPKLVETLEELVLGLRREQLTASKVESLFSLGPTVKEHYEKIKNGVRGILTPWPLINETTFGFWPMDLVLFVARVGIGKTWTAVILALEAWKQGKRVLFASTEISRMRIGMRLFSLMCQLPYSEFSKGRLTRVEHPSGDHSLDVGSEPRFYKAVQEFLHEERLYVVGGNFDFRVESLSAAIDEVRPDFVVLDGAYLLRTQGASRTEKAANAFDELKRLALRHEIAMAVTHQFNREVKANVATSVRTESIGLTDVAGWNADLIFGLVQTDDMKKEGKMRLKPLKVREGVGSEIEIRWDFNSMDFSQLGLVTASGSKSDGDAAEDFDGGGGGSGGDPSGGNEEVPF